MTATYEEVKDIPNQPQKYLIDVRNGDELAKTGVIPASINIPLAQLECTFNLSEDQFKEKYNREKPTKETEIIFHCMAGLRAKRAAEMAKTKGYTNVKAYDGSWNDWAAKEGL